jgi:hypothetical protein
MSVLELLAALRKTSSNSPLVTILEEAQALRSGAVVPPKPRKKYKQDIRTKRKNRARWKKEHADETRAYNEGLRGMFFHLRREVRRRARIEGSELPSNQWDITMGEWIMLWLSCPACQIAPNVYKPAWQLRGRDINTDVQLRRVDREKSWNINNLEILWKGKRINSGA